MDEGEPIVIDQSSVVTINASRADNTSKAFAGEVNGDGTVTVPITYWMLELDDKVSCDVSIIDTQGRKLSTLNFTIEVEHSNYSGDDISEDENYDLLVTLITEVAEAKDAEAKRVVAENARVVAEQARVTAENTRASAESTRTTNETARQTAEEERVAAEQARKQELNNKLDKSDIVQTTGQNTNAVMSQKAVTAEINTLASFISNIKQVPLIGGLSDTFRNHAISWALSCGVEIDLINAFRQTCVNGNPDIITVNIPTYSITNNLTYVTTDNDDTSVYENQSYEAQIEPQNGYIINSVAITMGGVDVTQYFNGEIGNLNRSITLNLQHCSIDNAKQTVIDGQGYGAEVTVSDGYTLDGATVSITMGDTNITNQVYIAYEEA